MDTQPTHTQTLCLAKKKSKTQCQVNLPQGILCTSTIFQEGITVQKRLLCAVKKKGQTEDLMRSNTQICEQIHRLTGYVLCMDLCSTSSSQKNQARFVFSTPCRVCACVSHSAQRGQSRLFLFFMEGQDRGEAGRGRRYRQERLTSPPRKRTSSFTSLSHLSCHCPCYSSKL